MPCCLAVSATAMADLMGRIWPSRASSPAKRAFFRLFWDSVLPRVKMVRAIGRSNWLPSFGSSAGARLMTIFPLGKSSRELPMALRTLSRASSMALLPMPTIWTAGRPLEISPSTSMSCPLKPRGVAVKTFPTMI